MPDALPISLSGLLIFLAVVVVGLVSVAIVRKWMRQSEPTTGPGFTLSDLRALHKAGQITNEEFDKARNKIVEAARRAADRSALDPRRPNPPRPDDPTV